MADFAPFTARVDIVTDGGAESGAVVHVAGEVDIVTAPELQLQLDTLLGSGCTELVLDLSAVQFIDAAGIGVLVGVGQRATHSGGHLTLRRPSPTVRQLLTVAELDGSLPTEE
jgi:anti-sigma B factor antagonist